MKNTVQNSPKEMKDELSHRYRLYGIFLGFFLGIMSAWGCGRKTSDVLVSTDGDPSVMEEETGEDTGEDTDENGEVTEEETTPEYIYVQVSGAVQSSGVYILPYQSRAFEAIRMAGGLTNEAEESSVNQALPLEDGQLLYVYSVGELQQKHEQEEDKSDGLVDLNLATKEEFMTLPGIGASKAEDILAYREASGPFTRVEDIMNIPGIKEGVFQRIKDKIKVN